MQCNIRADEPGPMRTIKKYPNRRLYDTEESRYITLDELAAVVRKGVDVSVRDVASGADLTATTLTQIILESRGGAKVLPVPLLTQMVRMGDDALVEFLGRYLGFAMEMYLSAKQGAQALSPINPLATVPFSASNALARLLLSGINWAQGPTPVAPAPPLDATPTPSDGVPALGDGSSETEVQALRREVLELKKAMQDEKRPRKR